MLRFKRVQNKHPSHGCNCDEDLMLLAHIWQDLLVRPILDSQPTLLGLQGLLRSRAGPPGIHPHSPCVQEARDEYTHIYML